jgi:hypothetical protein
MRLKGLSLAVVLSSLAIVAVAEAATGPSSGPIRLFVTPSQHQGGGTIIVAGAIGDYGTTTPLNKRGIGEAVLKKGTFEVDLEKVVAASNSAAPTLENAATCSLVFSFAGPVTITHGTGLYKGISGTATITETFAGIGPLYRSGAKKGRCDMSANAAPIAQWGSIIGIGSVKFR